jgi:Zn-dependent peptidase ImmA (M78 family)
MVKFTVDNETWVVRVVPSDHEGLKIDNNMHFGICNFIENIIYLDEEMSPTRLEKILLHELTHLLLNTSGNNMRNAFDQEDVCELFSHLYHKLNTLFAEIMYKLEDEYENSI